MAAQNVNVPFSRQEPQHDGFVAVDQRYDCGQCVTAHARRFEFPVLDPENVTAWTIFHEIADQVRIGMDVVGLDYGVLPVVFGFHRVPEDEQLLLYQKIAILSRAREEHRAMQAARKQSMDAEKQSQRVASGG